MMHCKSVVVAQELQTLLWAGINISTPPQNGGFSHYLGLFFFECSAFASLDGSHLEKCPGCILGICSVAFPGCDYWALQLQNKAGGSQPSMPVHTEVFLGWRSWLCSLYHWYWHWVVWKVWVQLLPGRSGAECVSFIPVNDLTSTQEWSNCTFLTLDMCLMRLVTACCSFIVIWDSQSYVHFPSVNVVFGNIVLPTVLYTPGM